ncbi:alpha-(1-_3)-arabinofuranosyltransferase domain-containing protein [Nocardioides houyundeii]|uniref:alpha-(1->3)-arabinofuranosyltransferase domain-containing protein n=1 Tax=Nocardioides houyundeii TaxID=2045452 RepID=UPI0013B36A7B|nr:alpha-(1->3)-arabinofuranosyltransferase family protein [Nocardioides houyundeii]
MAFSFLQRVGETTFDTKFDLAVRPQEFLARTLQAWNPQSSFGEMQNQAYGYLFPQGAFFLLGDELGIPDWVVQRLWSGLLLIAAFEGTRLLFRAIDHPRDRSWLPVLAGLAYALSPRMLGLSGVLTGELNPSAALPWVVLPLVLALRGRLSALHAALWSGVGVLMMGGVNATEVLCALPLPGLVIAFSLRHRVGRALALWWPLAVVASTLWWVLALLKQGRYSPPFLEYIETGAATTQPLGWANVTRGADHWLSFIWVGGQPWWPGSYQLATDPWLIVVGGLVAAVSLLGLFHRTMPYRVPLATSALLGMALLTLGRVEDLGSPLSPWFQALLDGTLSPFRNIHKLDPVVRLPMALGFAHGVGVLATRVRGRGWSWLPGRFAKPVLVGGSAVLLLLSAQPLFTGDLRKPGWEEVPDAWVQAASFLDREGGQGRTLVLPGAGFGQQTWGWTIDEPLQALASSPWVARSQVPLTPGSTIRYLDAIEERIQDGRGSLELAGALSRAGITHVLVRRDLDLWATEAPSPARVDLAISRSPGFSRIASFGSTGFGTTPLIDIYQVDDEAPLVEAVDLDQVKTLAGGPEDILSAMEAGVLEPDEVTVDAAEPGWETAPEIVGDGYRRRERQFGRLVDPVSQVMSLEEKYRTRRAAHDYPGVSDDRVHARYRSLAAIRASSSSGYVDSLGAIQPEMGPYAAVDGREETFWRSAPLEDPQGQWLELQFQQPQPLTGMRFVMGVDGVSGVPVTRVRVESGGKSREVPVDPATGEVQLAMDGKPVERVRIVVTDTRGRPSHGIVAIREISFPGIEIDRTLVVPDSGATGATAFVFRARPHRRACVDVGLGPQCDVASGRTSEEEHGLNRTFTTSSDGRFELRAEVVARASVRTQELLHPLPGRLSATASSVMGWDPSVAGQRAVDGNPATPWIAASADTAPQLTLEFGEKRTLRRLTVDASVVRGSQPAQAVLQGGGQRRVVQLGNGSLGYFKPLRTDRVRITFPMPAAGPDGSVLAPLTIGELNLEGAENLKAIWDPSSPTGAVCGFGPDVVLDGTRYPTRVSGTLGDVAGGTAMKLAVCGRQAVEIPAGTHRLQVTSSDQYAVTTLTLDPAQAPAEPAPAREVAVQQWDASVRSVRVGAGVEGVLRVPENVNEGWEATLDGKTLDPLRLDGWQQGYRLPAGAGGVVRLEFVPDRSYRTDLALGGVLALDVVIAALALQLLRRRRRPADGRSARMPQWLASWSPLTGALMALAAYLLGGVPLLVGVLAGGALRRRRPALLLLASALVVAASSAQAVHSWREDAVGVPWADLVAGVAVGLYAMALVGPGRAGRAR